ncbi:hypothetical protein KC19_VG068700 [Ceratodon purpureus]|uniref:peptidylprolyl isomerase n=1 Tax=Ceratodon purpureus TaxID=3225 RepID=A0A8T0HN46_CERPU|nr:hypothetical protein KC19_VG068700 [Ceratodon purpureus]
MASVLSLPRLPLSSPTTSSSRLASSQSAACNSRYPIRRSIGSERARLPDLAVGRNVAMGAARCCSGDEQGATSGSGRDEATLGRREAVLSAAFGAAVLGGFGGSGGEAMARDRRNRKEVAPGDYLTSDTGIKYFDVEEGKGALAEKGGTVMVHFDCVYRSITAVSSRESKILAGNRTIAEPYELTVGAEPGRERKRDFIENANGLFSAQASPKPPPALYAITEGMRVGGKRTVIVTPELGYGQRGLNEIPPGATFDLNIELLEVRKPQNEKSK